MLMSTKELSKRWGCSPSYVAVLCQQQRIPADRLSCGYVVDTADQKFKEFELIAQFRVLRRKDLPDWLHPINLDVVYNGDSSGIK